RALGRALARRGAEAQGLQLGEDGWGPDQAVAGGWRGMGLQPAADRQDGALQGGVDARGDLAGPRQVVKPLGPGAQVAPPPLVEPDLGAADSDADGLDGSAGEA